MKKYFKSKVIGGNILALEFKDAIPMTMMFMRFQEYGEGIPKIRDKDPVPEGDVLYHYYRKFGTIYYTAGYAGFNLRGDLFNEWRAKRGDIPYNTLESELEILVNKYFFDMEDDFFVIAYMKGDKVTKKHELLHALYYLNADYRDGVNAALNKVSTKRAKRYLQTMDYTFGGKHGDWILYDEIQAYVLSDDPEVFRLPERTLDNLKKLKKEYF
jgi:hypothetical protein